MGLGFPQACCSTLHKLMRSTEQQLACNSRGGDDIQNSNHWSNSQGPRLSKWQSQGINVEGRAGPIISAFQCGKISRSQELTSHHKPLGSKTLPPDSRIFREVGFKMSPGHHTSPYGTVLWDLPVWTNHSPCHSQSLCVLQPFFS